jgi:hypothetical protein
VATVLPITHIRQAPGLCGAAAAQMILHAKNLVAATQDAQDLLFKDIQNETQGTRPANVHRHDCPGWSTQLCTKCEGEPRNAPFRCWCTYPPALKATLALRGIAVRQTSVFNVKTATARIIESIDRQTGAAALVENGVHWVTVIGYAEGTGPADSRRIAGKWISDIYVHDPNLPTGAMTVPIVEWLDEYFGSIVQCGVFFDRIVTITAAAPRTS